MKNIVVPDPLAADPNNNHDHADPDAHVEEQPMHTELTGIPGVSSSFLIPDEEAQ